MVTFICQDCGEQKAEEKNEVVTCPSCGKLAVLTGYVEENENLESTKLSIRNILHLTFEKGEPFYYSNSGYKVELHKDENAIYSISAFKEIKDDLDNLQPSKKNGFFRSFEASDFDSLLNKVASYIIQLESEY